MADSREGEHALEVVLGIAHECAPQCCNDSERDENHAQSGSMPGKGVLKDSRVHSHHRIEPQFHHQTGEQNAYRRRRHRVCIRKPEVKRYGSSFDQEAAGNKEKGDDHQ